MKSPTLTETPPEALPAAVPMMRMLDALARKTFFKLICGGSFTEESRIRQMALAYSRAGANCIDIAPDPAALSAVSEALNASGLPQERRPVVMVSLPLDPDPHFRKIELDDPACIRCGVCVPACPTEAISLPDRLEISQSLCYGCGRCLPVCPTDALNLLPFLMEAQAEAALSHPLVQAVEIHSHYVDPEMLAAFLERWQSGVSDKLLSLCFRPGDIPPAQMLRFYETAAAFSPLPVILQVDGAPMSGTDAPDASLPALEAAVEVKKLFEAAGMPLPYVTISGGINRQTAALLAEASYGWLSGVGMGTVARQAVWNMREAEAPEAARGMVALFQDR